MISLKNAENALKEVYLGVISNQLDFCADPVFNKIKKTSSDIWGKYIIKIPKWAENYKKVLPKLELELGNIYGEIEISDKAIRAAENNSEAFVNLLNDEMENLTIKTKTIIADSFYSKSKKEDERLINLQGLEKIFSNSKTLYGLDRNKYKELNPVYEKLGVFDPIKIQEFIDNYNEDADFIICSPKMKRDYMQYCIDKGQNINVKDFGEEGKCIMFNNSIPIYTNKNVKDNEIYIIDSNDFKLHQLCNWKWLEDTNSVVLKQQPNKPSYKATLVKYGNILCENPYKQIKVTIK